MSYKSVDEFVADMKLVFDNCRQYNAADSPISALANRLEALTDRLIMNWVVGKPGQTKADLPDLAMLNDDRCGVRHPSRPVLTHCLPNQGSVSLCVFCSCCVQVCYDNDEKDDAMMLLCEGCDAACHTFCCDPPKDRIPDGDWWCPDCKKAKKLKRKQEKAAARD